MEDERESIWTLLKPPWPRRDLAGLCCAGWGRGEAVWANSRDRWF